MLEIYRWNIYTTMQFSIRVMPVVVEAEIQLLSDYSMSSDKIILFTIVEQDVPLKMVNSLFVASLPRNRLLEVTP